MTKKTFTSFIICGFVALFLATASAEDIYVKNKAFKGTVVGHGMTSEVSLQELSKALELEYEERSGLWRLGEFEVPGREQDGMILVTLRDLKKAGLYVKHSPDLGTIDIAVPKARAARGSGGTWGASNRPTLVFFGASWCGACKASKPALSQFESTHSAFNVVRVDMERKGSAEFKKYGKFFKGRAIPFWAVLNSDGESVHSFVGGQTYDSLNQHTRNYK